MSNLIIRSVQSSDIPAIAALHKRMFSTHFLGQYSESLILAFYREFVDSSTFLVSDLDGKICGFVLGGYDSNLAVSKNNFLRNKRAKYIIESITKPKIYQEGLKRLLLLLWNQGYSYTPSVAKYRLLSIAVSPAVQGKGIAASLVKHFEKKIPLDTEIYGLSVKSSNKRAIAFYEKLGFELEKCLEDGLYYTKKINR
ncbi:MAG: GNAT family N-acetyltransferase [Pelosinus sp.]|nr:GNAT family N-acetyltransferase [Pelosinus sp.]